MEITINKKLSTGQAYVPTEATDRNGYSKAEGNYAAAGGVPAASATEYLAYTVPSGSKLKLTSVHFQQDVGAAGTRVISLYDGLTVAGGTKIWEAPVTAADGVEYTYDTELLFTTGVCFQFNAALDTDFSYCITGDLVKETYI